jgi:1,2-phenylacetyl-CoA epoxidase PaaB subunit
MAKRPTEQPNHSWSIYRLRGTPAAFVGLVHAPDEKAALEKAIEEFGVPENQRNRLIARRRD